MNPTDSPLILNGVTRCIGELLILELDTESSQLLPSRGQVAVQATDEHGQVHTLVIEPDGRRGHWLPLDETARAFLAAQPGERLSMPVHICPQWPEPSLPTDFEQALAEVNDLESTWQDLTPMARWEWVRWIKSTKNPATRARRVAVGISKLRAGNRRPCCFDLSSCTVPEVAKSGKLIL